MAIINILTIYFQSFSSSFCCAIFISASLFSTKLWLYTLAIFTYTVVLWSRMYSSSSSICFELDLAFPKFSLSNFLAYSKVNSTIVFAPNQSAIFYKFFFDLPLTNMPSLSMKSTSVPIFFNYGYFRFEQGLQPSEVFFQFQEL